LFAEKQKPVMKMTLTFSFDSGLDKMRVEQEIHDESCIPLEFVFYKCINYMQKIRKS